jgi:N-acetylmuramoyl-L-alanine amidase
MAKRTRTDFIAIHCSATQPKQDIGAETIREWHLANGWRDIGYNYVIRRNGALEYGREESEAGAHVEWYNSVALGICLVGGIDASGKPENNFTQEQFAALKALLIYLKQKYPTAKIQGHRDFPRVAKACPSFDVKSWCAKEKI